MAESTSAKDPSVGEQRPPEQDKPSRRNSGRRASRPKSTDHQEVEWRFDAPDLSRVESWLVENSSSSGLTVTGGETRVVSDTYYDTEDWRVFRAGYALRVREGEGLTEATLKSLASENGASDEARRREISELLKDGDVKALRDSRGRVGELLRAFTGARELRPIFALRTRRRAFDLLLASEAGAGGVVVDASGDVRDSQAMKADGSTNGVEGDDGDPVTVDAADDIREPEAADEADTGDESEEIVVDASGNIRERESSDGSEGEEASGEVARTAGGRVVGEVALDSTEIVLGEGEEPARLYRVEVEADSDEVSPELETFVREMREALGLKSTRVSKYHAGLFATGQSPEAATDLGPTRIDASLLLGELVFAVLRRQFAEMRSHEAGSRLGEDSEEVHDMRVAIRRLRAAIKLFEDALPERARHLRGELKWVAGALGDVRDLDVQLEQIEEWSAGAEGEGQEALRRASSAMGKQREEARGRMIKGLDSARYERFESSFTEMLKLGPTRETVPGDGLDKCSRAGEPVLEAGPDLLSRRYRKWRKLARKIEDSSPPEDYHELRKEGKRLRYALEFFAEIYGEDATDGLVKPLKVLQDDLGRHQDAIVAAERLREISTGERRFPSRAAFFMGVYAGESLREAAEVRENLRDTKVFRAVAGGKAWKDFEKEISKPAKKTGKKK